MTLLFLSGVTGAPQQPHNPFSTVAFQRERAALQRSNGFLLLSSLNPFARVEVDEVSSSPPFFSRRFLFSRTRGSSPSLAVNLLVPKGGLRSAEPSERTSPPASSPECDLSGYSFLGGVFSPSAVVPSRSFFQKVLPGSFFR